MSGIVFTEIAHAMIAKSATTDAQRLVEGATSPFLRSRMMHTSIPRLLAILTNHPYIAKYTNPTTMWKEMTL
jgi:hypothetical protein